MARSTYTPEFKTKLVLQHLQGVKDINAHATENELNPGQIRTWKKEFLANAYNGPLVKTISPKNIMHFSVVKSSFLLPNIF